MPRIYHPWDRWECVPAGLYASHPPVGMTADDALEAYATFLRDTPRFAAALVRVVTEWPVSCEHFLSNPTMNRIAWLGQASMCIATGVPSVFRGGFMRLDDTERATANATALAALNRWLTARGDGMVTEECAKARGVVDDAWETADADSTIPLHMAGARVSRGHSGRGAIGIDASEPGTVLQGDCGGDPEERQQLSFAWFHHKPIAVVRGHQASRSRGGPQPADTACEYGARGIVPLVGGAIA